MEQPEPTTPEPTQPVDVLTADPRRPPAPVRWALWALSLAILGFAIHHGLTRATTSTDSEAVVRHDLRAQNALWRMAAWMGATQTKPVKAKGASAAEATPPPLQQWVTVSRASSAELMTRAMQLDSARGPKGESAVAEAVIGHCLAVEKADQAVEFALKLPHWSPALAAALTGLPAEITPTLGVRFANLPNLNDAQAAVQAPSYARNWSAWTRDRIRLQVALRATAGNRGAMPKGLTADLAARDRELAAVLWTAVQIAMLAGLLGLSFALVAGIRAILQAGRGAPAWQWLIERYPGLPNDNPYARDLLVPVVGVAAWIFGQGVTSGVLSQLGNGRGSPFAVLISAMVGVLLAQLIITALSPTRVPLVHAARLGGDPAAPFWRASTAALRAWSLLLPAMALLSVCNVLLVGDAHRIHPLAELALNHSDPVTLFSLGLAAVVMAPIGEELLFRGFLFRYFRQRFGFGVSLAVSSALFALLHFSPEQALPYMGLGAAFALTYAWVGNLWAPIIVHGLWNLAAYVMTVGIALS